MDTEVFNPLYTPSADERKRRGYAYPDTLTAFKAAAKRIAAIKRKQKAKK